MLFYQGGDQTFYYTTSWVLSDWHLPTTPIGYAWSYLLERRSRSSPGRTSSRRCRRSSLLSRSSCCRSRCSASTPSRRGSAAARSVLGGRALGRRPVPRRSRSGTSAITRSGSSCSCRRRSGSEPRRLPVDGLPARRRVLHRSARSTAGRWHGLLAGLAAGLAVGIEPANGLFLPRGASRCGSRGAGASALVRRRARPALLDARDLEAAPLLGTVPLLRTARSPVGAPALPPLAGLDRCEVPRQWSAPAERQPCAMREFFWSVRPLELIPLAGASRSPAAAPRRPFPRSSGSSPSSSQGLVGRRELATASVLPADDAGVPGVPPARASMPAARPAAVGPDQRGSTARAAAAPAVEGRCVVARSSSSPPSRSSAVDRPPAGSDPRDRESTSSRT